MGLLRAYGSFCVGFGFYGLSRGLRIEDCKNNKDIDFVYKAAINGFYYALPPWQFYNIKSLLERIELQRTGFNKINKRHYKETNGICWDTI